MARAGGDLAVARYRHRRLPDLPEHEAACRLALPTFAVLSCDAVTASAVRGPGAIRDGPYGRRKVATSLPVRESHTSAARRVRPTRIGVGPQKDTAPRRLIVFTLAFFSMFTADLAGEQRRVDPLGEKSPTPRSDRLWAKSPGRAAGRPVCGATNRPWRQARVTGARSLFFSFGSAWRPRSASNPTRPTAWNPARTRRPWHRRGLSA